jgi:hypothetical protein
MVKLPPRTVTTEIIPFGSQHERSAYFSLEARNQQRFRDLRRESVNDNLKHFVDLTRLALGTRQAPCESR